MQAQQPPEAVVPTAGSTVPHLPPLPDVPTVPPVPLEAVAPAPTAPLPAATAGLIARVFGSLLLPLLAGLMGLVLLMGLGHSPTMVMRNDALLVLPLLLGQAVATWHWFWRGAVFSRAVLAFGVLGGVALGSWGLLIFEALQRGALQASLQASRGTPWEGLATVLTWALLACALPLMALAGLLLWRQLAQAVLAGRVLAAAAHDIQWVLCVVPLALVAWVLCLPLDLPGTDSLLLEGTPWALVAQRLSVFVDGSGAGVFALCGSYVVLRLALGEWQHGGLSRRAAPGAMPPLVLLDLRGDSHTPRAELRELHAFANTWGQARGAVVLVRPASQAALGAGSHARWAQAARRLPELFVDGPAQARLWCASWLAPGAGPFARECFVAQPGDFREVVLALQASAPGALFVVLVLHTAVADEALEPLRLALPKARSLALVPPDNTLQPPRRMATVVGRLWFPWHRQQLVRELAQLQKAPPVQTRLAIIGRPRSDRLADALVAALDQQLPDGETQHLDAQRPARDAAAAFDRVLLLVDAAWLRAEPEACVEAAALQPLLRAAGRVMVMTVGAARVDSAGLARALAVAGGPATALMLGGLPEQPQDWPAARVIERVLAGEAAPVETQGAGPAAASDAPSALVHRVTISHARAKDEVQAGWTAQFLAELQRSLDRHAGGRAPGSARFEVADASPRPEAKLAERMGADIAEVATFVALVDDAFVDSAWCRRELESFIARRLPTWRESCFLVATTLPAVQRLQRHPDWQPLVAELAWLPFFDPERPGQAMAALDEQGRPQRAYLDSMERLAAAIAESDHAAHAAAAARAAPRPAGPSGGTTA